MKEGASVHNELTKASLLTGNKEKLVFILYVSSHRRPRYMDRQQLDML